MAKTWPKKGMRSDPFVDALAARRVLRDCYIAKQELSETESGARWRLRWFAAVTLLRTVGHVLKLVDGKRSPFLKEATEAAWDRWKSAPQLHIVFFEFIKRERDFALKEYELGSAVAVPPTEIHTHQLAHPILFGSRLVMQVDLVREAITWWETELEDIEADARSRRLSYRGTHPRAFHKKCRTKTKQ